MNHPRISSGEVVETLNKIYDLDDQKQKACAHLYATLVRDDDVWSYLVIGRRHRNINDAFVTDEGDTVYPGDPRHPGRKL